MLCYTVIQHKYIVKIIAQIFGFSGIMLYLCYIRKGNNNKFNNKIKSGKPAKIMKVDNKTIESMVSDITTVIEYFESSNNTKYNISEFTISTKFAIWSHVHHTKTFDLNNANVLKNDKGERLLEYDEDFDFYVCGTNDKTIETALNKSFEIINNNRK